jgi:DNA repair exonuclease SbcCD ATPase subunit
MKLLLGIAGLTTVLALLPSPLSPRTFFTTAQTAPADSVPEAQTDRFKIRLTLSSSTDLKVREGDEITKGEVLADRTRDRTRLDAQKRQIQLRIARLKQPIAAPPLAKPIPEVAGLPPTSFLDEAAKVSQAQVKIEAAEAAVTQQQRMLDLLEATPNAELPESTLPHEREVLKQKQQELAQAIAELELAKGQLSQAQAERQYQEYQYSLELSKRAIALQQSELQRQEQLQHQEQEIKDREFQIAQLEGQVQAIETQMVQLSSVRSPFSGKIRRVKFEEQNDQNLTVELQLIANVDGKGSGSRAAP